MAHATSVLSELKDEHSIVRAVGYPDAADLTFGSLDQRYRALVLVAAYGGFRFGELAGLRRHRVDVAGRVRVVETCVESSGRLHVGPPKSEAGRRTVPLPPFVLTVLREHESRWSQPAFDGLVFTAPEGGPLRRSNFRAKVWVPALQRAGLEGLRVHDLRHTAISLWIAAGGNLLEVKTLAGHERSSFTVDRYGHLFDKATESLAQRLDALYGATGGTPAAQVRQLPR